MKPTFDADHLCVWHKNTEFMSEPRFVEAYERAMDSGHRFGSIEGLDLRWRVHTLVWAAWHGMKLEGDLVECGVNTGIYSLAVAHYCELNESSKHLYLSTPTREFSREQISEREASLGRLDENETYYEDCYEIAVRNFVPFPNAVLVRGRVPHTLDQVEIERVCYLSLDMNIVAPEVAAIRHFWPGRSSPPAHRWSWTTTGGSATPRKRKRWTSSPRVSAARS